MKKYEIWDLEKYKVEEPNKYSDIIDKRVFFDYFNREEAMKNLFESTDNPEVKQVLRYAMELNNKYRTEAMALYDSFYGIMDYMDKIKKMADDAVDNAYL